MLRPASLAGEGRAPPGGREPPGRRLGDDRGLVATVIILPVVVIAAWLSIQAALVMHAQNVVRAAAEDAAVAAASHSGDPRATARSLVEGSAGDITSDVSVNSDVGPELVTVTVTADVKSVVPFGSFTVTESASAPVEVFIPEPERP
jgi:Flp pilus assembly protein TadG